MAFRKRNVAVGTSESERASTANGIRPSSLISHPVTSTGSSSLDALLGGHGGLALGSSLLLQESGTTDFAGALLRYFTAQGICHDQIVHLVGVDDNWIRSLPGVVDQTAGNDYVRSRPDTEKMKIAWRYENLGHATARALPTQGVSDHAKPSLPNGPFSHSFDLSKRFLLPHNAKIHRIPILNSPAPLDGVLRQLQDALKSSTPSSVHRLIIPSILNPASYPPSASHPGNFLRFLHWLRALLRQYPNKLVAMITLPLELYPRNLGLVRWAEILSDGVLELQPFPHTTDSSSALAESGGARGEEEQPQGLFRVHKLPVNTERGEGGAGAENSIGDDLAFTISRRKFVIKPFSLPPLEAQDDSRDGGGKLTGKAVDF